MPVEKVEVVLGDTELALGPVSGGSWATAEVVPAVFFSKDFVQYLDQRALATSQTETGAAPWNRDQLSDPSKSNNRIAA